MENEIAQIMVDNEVDLTMGRYSKVAQLIANHLKSNQKPIKIEDDDIEKAALSYGRGIPHKYNGFKEGIKWVEAKGYILIGLD